MPGLANLPAISAPNVGAPNALGTLGMLAGAFPDMQREEVLKHLAEKEQGIQSVQAIGKLLLPQIEANKSDPRMIAMLSHLYKQVGLPAPIDKAQPTSTGPTQTAQQDPATGPTMTVGTNPKQPMPEMHPGTPATNYPDFTPHNAAQPEQIDVNALGAKADISSMSPDDYAKILNIKPGPARTAYLQSHYFNPTEDMINAPWQPTGPEFDAQMRAFQGSLSSAAQHGPEALEIFLGTNHDNLIALGMNPDFIKTDPTLIAPMAAQEAAKLQNLQDLHLKLKDVDIPTAQARLLSAKSLDELRDTMGKLNLQRVQSLSVGDRIKQQTADADTSKAATAAGQLQERINEALGGTYDKRMQVKSQVFGDVSRAKSAADARVAQLTGIVQGAINNGESPDPSAVASLKAAQDVQTQVTAQYNALSDPSWAKGGVTKSLTTLGKSPSGGGATRTGKQASAPGKPTLYEYSDGTWRPN